MEETKKTTTRTTVKKQDKPEVKNELSMVVFGKDGKEAETVSLDKTVFAVAVNQAALAQYIRVNRINNRQGTKSAKTRSEVTGSTRKIFRQKGTGRARHGDIKAPIFVGGGVAGGPQPVDYHAKINKKVANKALSYALTLKAADKKVVGLAEDVLAIEGKSKNVRFLFKAMDVLNRKMTVVLPKVAENGFIKASRNFPGVAFIDAMTLNAYEVVNADKLVFTKESLKVLVDRLIK